jgi:hypothetical protein
MVLGPDFVHPNAPRKGIEPLAVLLSPYGQMPAFIIWVLTGSVKSFYFLRVSGKSYRHAQSFVLYYGVG